MRFLNNILRNRYSHPTSNEDDPQYKRMMHKRKLRNRRRNKAARKSRRKNRQR